MGVFTKDDFEQAEREGRFVVRNRLPFGATSVDIRVKKLFRQPRILTPSGPSLEEITNASTDRFLEYLLEVPLEREGYWVLEPDDLYFFLAEEEVFKKKEQCLQARMITRSSWARFGVRVQETDEKLSYVNREFDDKIVGSLTTSGTFVKLRPGDAPCQIVAGDSMFPLLREEIAQLIASGRWRIVRDGKEAMDLDLTASHTKGLTLTLDRKIKMYTGGLIDPKAPSDSQFEEICMDEKGIYGRAGDFFISSSAEWMSICSCYIGWVWHNRYTMSALGFSLIDAHPNAPMIHPRRVFEGKITLENHPRINRYHIKPGMPIANINLMMLESPLWEGKESRYKGQDEATLSRESSENREA